MKVMPFARSVGMGSRLENRMTPSLTRRTQQLFRDYVVRELNVGQAEDLLRAAGLQVDSHSTPRRDRSEGTLRRLVDSGLAGDRDRAARLRFCELVLEEIEDRLSEHRPGGVLVPVYMNGGEQQIIELQMREAMLESWRRRLVQRLAKDGYHWDGEDLRRTHALIVVPETIENVAALEALLARLRRSLDGDPEAAVGTAKELVEAVCLTVLARRGKTPSKRPKHLNRLARIAMEELQLLPDDIREQVRGEQSAKQVLGSLASIVQGMAELRNLYGTGHGRADIRGVSARHARLSATSATAFAVFMMETLEERDSATET